MERFARRSFTGVFLICFFLQSCVGAPEVPLETLGPFEAIAMAYLFNVTSELTTQRYQLSELRSSQKALMQKLLNIETLIHESEERVSDTLKALIQREHTIKERLVQGFESSDTQRCGRNCGVLGFECVGGKWCMAIFRDEKNWENARNFCQEIRTELVAIETEEKHAAMADYVRDKFVEESENDVAGIWIGARFDRTRNNFVWESSDTLLSYTYWEAGNPNNMGGNQYCVEMNPGIHNFTWNDDDCSTTNRFICEVLEWKT